MATNDPQPSADTTRSTQAPTAENESLRSRCQLVRQFGQVSTYLIEREFGSCGPTANEVEARRQLECVQNGAQTSPKPVADDRVADASVDRECHQSGVRRWFVQV